MIVSITYIRNNIAKTGRATITSTIDITIDMKLIMISRISFIAVHRYISGIVLSFILVKDEDSNLSLINESSSTFVTGFFILIF